MTCDEYCLEERNICDLRRSCKYHANDEKSKLCHDKLELDEFYNRKW